MVGNVQNNNITGNDNSQYNQAQSEMGEYGLWLNLAYIAVATASTIMSYNIAKLNERLARNYFDLAKENQDYFRNTFKPCEIKAVSEACSAEKYIPKYAVIEGRFSNNIRIAFKRSREDLIEAANKYATGLTADMVREMATKEANAVGNSINDAYRYEEDQARIFDDLRINRRNQILNLGRGLASQQVAYGQLAASIGNKLGEAYGNTAGQAFSLLANNLGRQNAAKPFDPTGTATPKLSTPSINIPSNASGGYSSTNNVGSTGYNTISSGMDSNDYPEF